MTSQRPTRRSVPYGYPRSARQTVTPAVARQTSASTRVRRGEPSSDSLGAWMFEDNAEPKIVDEDNEPMSMRDAFDQLENTDASTGVAPGDPGSDMPYLGDK